MLFYASQLPRGRPDSAAVSLIFGSERLDPNQGRRQGGLWGAEAPPPPETWDGGPREGCRQGNRGFVVRWWVACVKNVRSY
jgi:hypothetical protein